MDAENNPCVIDPRKGRREQSLPPNGVLVFSPQDLASFAAGFARPPVRTHKLYLTDVYTAELDGGAIALAGPMLGAPQTILVLEKMIALGAKRFIALGWCGAINAEVKIADIVLPTGAVSEEGTSTHYPGAQCLPSKDLFLSLRSSLASSGKTVHEGAVWTTDAPFRETCEKVKSFQAQGVLSVDMETSALFSVARFRGVDLAVALVVSDDLSGLRWVHGFRDAGFKESRQKVIQAVLTSICQASGPLL
ncbi:MAG: nucleoside phosphorylase [Syntrophobacteraceae bacterium]|nr:nucleoside phosphorylase [Syntrophobacteraceae bacterium]